MMVAVSLRLVTMTRDELIEQLRKTLNAVKVYVEKNGNDGRFRKSLRQLEKRLRELKENDDGQI